MFSVDSYDISLVLFNKLLGPFDPKMKAVRSFETSVTKSGHGIISQKKHRHQHRCGGLKYGKQIAHKTVICRNPLIHSFAGHRKNLTYPQ
jgi:hypothetical protein